MTSEFLQKLFKSFKKKEDTIPSPDYLGHRPKTHKPMMRVGRTPILMALGGTLVLAVIFGITFGGRSAAGVTSDPEEKTGAVSETENSFKLSFLEKKQREGVITPDNPSSNTLPGQQPGEQSNVKDSNELALSGSNGSMIQSTAPNPYQDAQFQMWQQREQEKYQMEQARRAALHNALNAEPTVYSNNGMAGANSLYGSVRQSAPGSQSLESGMEPKQQPVNLPNVETSNYLLHTRVQAASPFEVKAGTVIPSIMLGGVNSDLPGQIMAQVSQNVFDTATGRHLLIPQGSRLVGNYDHQVIQGQNRVMVVWNRLIYPDASSVNLDGMAGADQGGYAGFKDKTNTHFWPTFSNALMLSAITAGVQLSQPQPRQGDSSYSGQQVVAGSLGMQMNNLGIGTIGRNMGRAPTLQIRPGYVFNVLVNRDMILPPWQGHVAYGGRE